MPAENDWELRRVEAAYGKLGRADRELLWWVRIENRSYREIAPHLRVSAATVERRTARMICTFCKALEDVDRGAEVDAVRSFWRPILRLARRRWWPAPSPRSRLAPHRPDHGRDAGEDGR